jgi:putative ABC transport system permease protein
MNLSYDFRYAVRTLTRSYAFTLTTVMTLALGTGATTAIFTVIYAVLLRPLPYAEPDRMAFVWSTEDSRPSPLTPGRLLDVRTRLTSAASVAGISHISFNITGSGDPERLPGSSVSSNFFDVLGVRAAHGDTFHDGSADPGDVVITHGLWTRRFGADPALVGRAITLNGSSRRVVGVMPAAFEWPVVTASGTSNGQRPELWVPANYEEIPRTPLDDPTATLSSNRTAGYLRAVARLKAGTTIAQAQREADLLASALASEHREDVNRGLSVQPLRDQFFGSVRQPLATLAAAAVFVLAIACANAASLLLGRATARRRELAVRVAIGATRGRIVGQVLLESLLLSTAAAALGLVVAGWAKAWLLASAPANLLRTEAVVLDPHVLVFCAAAAVATGLLFGSIPAWQASRALSGEDLAEGGRGSTASRGGRVRDALVVAQIAVALVLLVGAGLLLRSLLTLSRVDTGIDTRNLLAFDVVLSGRRAEYQRLQLEFYDAVLREVRSLPGVRTAGAAVTLPIGGDDFGASVVIEGAPAPLAGREPRAGYQIVTPDYFRTMGIPVRAGRDFGPGDTKDGNPVVIVNETFARQHWPQGAAIGRRLRTGGTPWLSVVGVVADIRHLGPAVPPRPEVYQAAAQQSFPFMSFVVRTESNPRAVISSIRGAIARIDPQQPISNVMTMEEHLANALSRPRFLSTLVASFGTLALALAAIGVYGVMSYSVAQRCREIAIRAALGATRRDIVRLVLTKAAAIWVCGIAIGGIAAAAASRGLGTLLYGVVATDPSTYASVTSLLCAATLAAALVPALRASRVSAADALRY